MEAFNRKVVGSSLQTEKTTGGTAPSKNWLRSAQLWSPDLLAWMFFTSEESRKLRSCISDCLRHGTVAASKRRIAPSSAQIVLNAAPEVRQRQQALSQQGRLSGQMAEAVLRE